MLRVCPENRRYIEFRGRPTALVTNGEHYGAVLNTGFDTTRYLDTLAADRLNLTRVFSGAYREGWGPGWNTLNPAPEQFLAPWARSTVPGYQAGGNKFDLNQWDAAYWKRLRAFAQAASKRGIVVEYVLFCVWYDDATWQLSPLKARNNINGIGRGVGKDFFTEKEPDLMAAQAALVRKAVTELSRFDNVYFELCNEPYFDGPPLESAWNRRMVGEVRAVAPKALIALNVANGSQRMAVLPEGVDILNFHYASPPKALEENAALHCPISFDESGFRGSAPLPYRTEAWEFLLAGGAAYNGLDWSFTVGKEEGISTAADDRLGPRSPALRKSLGALRQFLDLLDLRKVQPHPELLGSMPQGVQARLLAQLGRQYALYLHHPEGTTVTELTLWLETGRYKLRWVNPETGTTVRTTSLTHSGGPLVITVPSHKVDIALALTR